MSRETGTYDGHRNEGLIILTKYSYYETHVIRI